MPPAFAQLKTTTKKCPKSKAQCPKLRFAFGKSVLHFGHWTRQFSKCWQPVRHVITGRNSKRAEVRQIPRFFARHRFVRTRQRNFRRERRGQRGAAINLAESRSRAANQSGSRAS